VTSWSPRTPSSGEQYHRTPRNDRCRNRPATSFANPSSPSPDEPARRTRACPELVEGASAAPFSALLIPALPPGNLPARRLHPTCNGEF
jgi:hypothetical protein